MRRSVYQFCIFQHESKINCIKINLVSSMLITLYNTQEALKVELYRLRCTIYGMDM